MNLTRIVVSSATLIAALTAACGRIESASTAEKAPASSEASGSATTPVKTVAHAAYTKSFSVKGMHCDGCVRTVTKKVKAVDGVVDCAVDLKGERATVAMDDASRSDEIVNVLKKLGYEVEPIND